MRLRIVLAALAIAGVVTQAVGAAEKSLYERLGGQAAIVAVVDDFVGNVAGDKRINGFFAKADAKRVKEKLVEQICQASGGPCTYTGKDMKSVHKGMGISNKHFDFMVQDLAKALNKFKVPKKEQRELIALLAPMRKDIVEKK
jgi:hemoglobin